MEAFLVKKIGKIDSSSTEKKDGIPDIGWAIYSFCSSNLEVFGGGVKVEVNE